MAPRFFPTPAAWRRWLAANHARADELWVGFHKKGTGRPSITWPESVDEALCYGWIDGLRRSLDADRYVIRFTPRRPGSTWSAVNIRKVADLKKRGRMTPAGLAAFRRRTADNSQRYAYEQRRSARLPPDLAREFRAATAAWAWFSAEPPSYRSTAIHWVITAKQAATRRRRFATLVADSAAGLRIKPLRRAGPPARPGG